MFDPLVWLHRIPSPPYSIPCIRQTGTGSTLNEAQSYFYCFFSGFILRATGIILLPGHCVENYPIRHQRFQRHTKLRLYTMGTLLLGLKPWMEKATFQALMKEEYTKEAKIVQVLTQSHDRQFVVSDREASMDVFLTFAPMENEDVWTPGTLVKLVDWQVRSSLTFGAKVPTKPLCLQISGMVTLVGAQDMGIVGDPIDIHQTIDVRRAMEYLGKSLVNVSQQLGYSTEIASLGEEISDTLFEQVMAQGEFDRRQEEQLVQSQETNNQRESTVKQPVLVLGDPEALLQHPADLEELFRLVTGTLLGDATALLQQPFMVEALLAQSQLLSLNTQITEATVPLDKTAVDDCVQGDGSMVNHVTRPAPMQAQQSDATPVRTNTTIKTSDDVILDHTIKEILLNDGISDEDVSDDDTNEHEPRGISSLLIESQQSSDDDDSDDENDKKPTAIHDKEVHTQVDAKEINGRNGQDSQGIDRVQFRSNFEQSRIFFKLLLNPNACHQIDSRGKIKRKRKENVTQGPPAKRHTSLMVLLHQKTKAK